MNAERQHEEVTLYLLAGPFDWNCSAPTSVWSWHITWYYYIYNLQDLCHEYDANHCRSVTVTVLYVAIDLSAYNLCCMWVHVRF